jgi:aminoglycoside 2''-phosphotransferase
MEVDQKYLDQIQELAPDLTVRQIELNTEGLVNDVVVINQQRIFRFPKNDWAKTALYNEAKVLALARQFVSVRLPHFDLNQNDIVSYEFIPGEALLRDDILRQDTYTQDALAETLAEFLAQLHTIPQSSLDEADIQSSDTVRTAEDWLQLYEATQREMFPLLMSDAKEWVHRLFTLLVRDNNFMNYTPVLIHGDLGAYHILCERIPCHITGIIDFGVAGRGDPAADFACLINVYGETFLHRMAKYYPAIKEHIERARFWAGTLELQWLLGGMRSADLSWFTVHIGRARDVNPVGSGW